MDITFYDSYGRAIAYTDDGKYIYLFSGKPVAYIDGKSIFSYGGSYLGMFEDGWVTDRQGKCVFFTEMSSGGPLKPVRTVKPVKGVKGIKPTKGIKQLKPVRAVLSLSWSAHSGISFFEP
jgi:hypothetical protein